MKLCFETDLDWTATDVQGQGYFRLVQEFAADPMLQLLSDDSRSRLAGYLADALLPKNGEEPFTVLNYSQAYWATRQKVEGSLYAGFGGAFGSQVGYAMQRAWYPTCFKENT